MIRVKNLTKDFGRNRGIFDISFEIADGEIFGYLGPDGAGKTTTFRQLLGFAESGRGRCFINGRSCHSKEAEVRGFTGYIPERNVLPQDLSGLAFLRFLAGVKGVRSLERANRLADRFELDLEQKIKRMPEENQKKLAVVSAFFHDPAVLLLDEPTKGMDALSKYRFASLLQEEKARGKTIMIASSEFEELEHVCDRIGMIKAGMLIKIDDIADIRAVKKRRYVVTFASEEEGARFTRADFSVVNTNGRQITVSVTGEMTPLIRGLADYEVVGIETAPQSLEEIFTYYYGGDVNA